VRVCCAENQHQANRLAAGASAGAADGGQTVVKWRPAGAAGAGWRKRPVQAASHCFDAINTAASRFLPLEIKSLSLHNPYKFTPKFSPFLP